MESVAPFMANGIKKILMSYHPTFLPRIFQLVQCTSRYQFQPASASQSLVPEPTWTAIGGFYFPNPCRPSPNHLFFSGHLPIHILGSANCLTAPNRQTARLARQAIVKY